MLSADHASVRRRGDELRLVAIDERVRARVEALAGAYRELARAAVGRAREDVEAGFRELVVPATERRLAAAVLKLVRDGCVFEEATGEDATSLRRALFQRAGAARRAGAFDRGALVEAVASERGAPAATIEQGLFSDRAGAQRLLAVEAPLPAALAAGFELAQAQAVLLRAVKVVATVRARDAGTYRRLFRQLKFLRLLPTITPLAEGGYRLEIDGPFSLFQAVTRYGLQLEPLRPALRSSSVRHVDDRGRRALGRRAAPWRASTSRDGRHAPARREGGRADAEPRACSAMPGALETFVAAFDEAREPLAHRPRSRRARSARRGPVRPRPGLRAPRRRPRRARAPRGARLLEPRGRSWRRVDLVARRVASPHILFAVSRDLRVSEEILEDDLRTPPSTVFTRVLGARAVLEVASTRSAPDRADARRARRGRCPCEGNGACCLAYRPRSGRRAPERSPGDLFEVPIMQRNQHRTCYCSCKRARCAALF